MTEIKKTKIICLDFDGTLSNNPENEDNEGIKEWERITGKPYPHPKKGWWGKPESLDLSVFDIQPIDAVHDIVLNRTDNDVTILLTNRIVKMREHVQAILDKHDIKLDHVTFKMGNETKGQRIEKFIERYPDTKRVEFYDDMAEHFTDAQFLFDKYPLIEFHFYLVTKGVITEY